MVRDACARTARTSNPNPNPNPNHALPTYRQEEAAGLYLSSGGRAREMQAEIDTAYAQHMHYGYAAYFGYTAYYCYTT